MITADIYIKTGNTGHDEGNWVEPTTKEDYRTYTDGTSTVWVKISEADTTPPVWTSGYPHTFHVQDEDLILVVSADENCTVYYVILADGAAAPSADQVQDQRDAGGNEVPGGYFPYTNSPNDRNHWVGGLTPDTAYDIYIVLQDVEDNLQAEPVRIGVTTLPDIDTVPYDSNSGITGQEPGPAGNRQVTLTVTVRNAAGEAITGIGPGYFEVSIDGDLTLQFVNNPPFSDFTDNGDGTYTVVFAGDADDTEYSFTNLTVFGVVIENSPTTVTTPSAAPEPDTTPPAVETYSPADGATGVAIDTKLVLTFSEDVASSVVGHVYLNRAADDVTVQTFAVDGPAVTVSGDTVTIGPDNLEYSTGYYVTIDAGAFEDAAGNPFAGISGSSAWNFTTVAEGGEPADTTAPSVLTGLEATDLTTSRITIEWDDSTDAGGIAGYDIQMKQGSGGDYSIVGSTERDDTEFTITGLDSSTTYYFQVRAKDVNGNISNWSTEISATTKRSSGGDGGGGTSAAPPLAHNAVVTGIASVNTIPVNVNSVAGSGTVNLEPSMAESLFSSEGTSVITIPSIQGAVLGDRPLVQLTLTADDRQVEWNNPDAPITVSIPYIPTAAELQDPEHIVIGCWTNRHCILHG